MGGFYLYDILESLMNYLYKVINMYMYIINIDD